MAGVKQVPVLVAENLTKSFGNTLLFDDVSFGIAEGQRVGLIAKNGTGKSTLLSLITGRDTPDSGTLVFRRDLVVAYLEQTPHFSPDDTVLDACFNHQGNPDKVLKAKQTLTKLKINDLSQRMGTLSGGQQKRVALANVLLTEPQFLILDEPTNHLDLEMIEWLEDYLTRKNLTLLMVTHDRRFLDNVCNLIFELDDQALYSYSGNYAYYLEKREQRIEVQRAEVARANNLYRRELEWMRRQPQARGHKARYREEAFYELQQRAKRRIEERQVRLKSRNTYIGSKIFECQYVSKSFNAADTEKVILKDFYYNFARFEKMGIVGSNGSGKSTFVKLLLGEIAPDAGKFDIGQTVRFGYFAQETPAVDTDKRVIDVVRDVAEYIDLGGGQHLTASQLLQHFLFTPEQQYNYVYKLSGGERRKLYLCTVLMQQPNFLVLDEPTNDLDIPTLQVLEQYLEDFPGCVIIVSHDRYFTDKLVDHILVFHGDGQITDFPGNYTQYRQWKKLASAEETTEKGKGVAEKSSQNSSVKLQNQKPETRRLTYGERLEMKALEEEIESLEQQQRQIENDLSDTSLTVEQQTEKSMLFASLKQQCEEKTNRWLELSERE